MRDYFFEADITLIGGSVVLKDKISKNIRYEIFSADMIYEGTKIPVLYKKYRKGRGKIEYLINETTKEGINIINEQLEFNYKNDINGMKKNIRRRVIYTGIGFILFTLSMTLGTIFGVRVFYGGAYLPCMTMELICGLIGIYISNLTDRIVRD